MPRDLSVKDLRYAYLRGYDAGMRAGKTLASMEQDLQAQRRDRADEEADSIAAKAREDQD